MKTIYLDPNDEITVAIDKIKKHSDKDIALVVPKTATLMQSLINLKILKKEADKAEKDLVLVSEDKIGKILAEKVGLAVNARVPTAAEKLKKKKINIEEEGKSAGLPFHSKSIDAGGKKASFDIRRAKNRKPATKKKLKIPKFSFLKNKVGILIAAAFLVLFVLLALFFLLPEAKVVMALKVEKIKTSFNLTLSESVVSPDQEKGIMPARVVRVGKSMVKTAKTTGKREIGVKARGTIGLVNETGIAQNLVSGTRVVSSGGKIFLTSGAVTIPAAKVDALGKIVNGKATVSVSSLEEGKENNISPSRYTIPGLSSVKQSKIYGNGSQMSGGDSRVANIVSNEDFEKLKGDALKALRAEVKHELETKKEDGEIYRGDLKVEKITKLNSNPEAGGEGSTFTLNLTIETKAYFVQESDLKEIISSYAQKEVEGEKKIQDSGILENTKISFLSESEGKIQVETEPLTIPDFDEEKLKENIMHLSKKEAEEYLNSFDEIIEARVELSPFFVRSVPNDEKKIKIEVREREEL